MLFKISIPPRGDEKNGTDTEIEPWFWFPILKPGFGPTLPERQPDAFGINIQQFQFDCTDALVSTSKKMQVDEVKNACFEIISPHCVPLY